MNRFIVSLIFVSLFFSCSSSKKASNNNDSGVEVEHEVQPSNEEISDALKTSLKVSVDETAKDMDHSDLSANTIVNDSDTPLEVKNVLKKERSSGDNELINDFDNSLNDALGDISGAAVGIFDAAIKEINFGDAFKILMGGENAATRYLQTHAGPVIQNQLNPIIEKSLTSSGTLDKWSALVSNYEKVTGKEVDANLVDLISKQFTDDFFKKVGQEEAKFRLNSYLWTNVVLKNVFGLQKNAYFNKR